MILRNSYRKIGFLRVDQRKTEIIKPNERTTMKLNKIILTAVLVSLPAAAMAEGKGPDRERRNRGDMRERILNKFDADGNGELSAEERAAFKKARETKRAEMIKAYDTDGDGQLSKAERKAAMKAFRAKTLEEFDTDGDGKLSKEERTTARETMRERGERPPFPPKGRNGRKGKKGGPDGRRGGSPAPAGEGLPEFD